MQQLPLTFPMNVAPEGQELDQTPLTQIGWFQGECFWQHLPLALPMNTADDGQLLLHWSSSQL
jgi:hypothetical protein